MQSDYESYLTLYKYGLNAALAMAENYFDYARQLRTLQLKTDKEMLAFAQQASIEIENMPSANGIQALQQKLATDLLGRELDYLREIDKIARQAVVTAAATMRENNRTWREHMSQLAQNGGRILAGGSAPGAASHRA
ncbi:MAG: hypothetical protein EPN41_09160 [Candidimonas sp.]|nr:MAG: hypothetical protein EPN41_09160 [Candidimonas sp.]